MLSSDDVRSFRLIAHGFSGCGMREGMGVPWGGGNFVQRLHNVVHALGTMQVEAYSNQSAFDEDRSVVRSCPVCAMNLSGLNECIEVDWQRTAC